MSGNFFFNISKNILKNTPNISNITKYVLKKCRKPKSKPHPTRRCYVFDCFYIYYLLIIANPNSALLYIQ